MNPLQNELIREEFRRATEYADEYQSDTPIGHFFTTRVERVLELLSGLHDGRVLDIGCGPGIIGITFRGRPIHYVGLDLAQEMIRKCVETFGCDPQYHFILGNIEQLPFADSSFDVVLCLGAFEYVDDEHIAIKEISRVLKTEGVFIVSMLNGMSPYLLWNRIFYWKLKNRITRLGCLLTGAGERDGHMHPKVKLYSETALRRLLVLCGLQVHDTLYYDFNLFFSPLDTVFPKASISVSKRLEVLCRSRLKFLGTGYILKCTKG